VPGARVDAKTAAPEPAPGAAPKAPAGKAGG
jgi:hypothetical protein